jgi:ketosteroid isomerase-like protein
MRTLFVLISTCLLSAVTSGQTTGESQKEDKVREELRKLYADYNEAGAKRDRAALERLFADDYVWVQGNGSVTTKAKHIDNIMANSAAFSAPAPPFEQFSIHGDVAVFRSTERKAGLFATTVFAKIDGRWQFLHAQGTLLPPERKPVEIDPKALYSLVGSYEFGPGSVATATKEGDALMWKGGRRPTVKLLPLSETQFFVEETGVQMIFHKDDKGQTTGVTLRVGTYQDSEAKKVQ